MKNIFPSIILVLIFSILISSFSHAEEITACAEINGAGNDSGYYYLNGNISGGNQTDGIGTISCILVSVSNIRINCQGNTINGNESAGYSLNIDGGGPLTNVSIENCRITGANAGVAQSSTQYSNFTNNTIAVNGFYAMITSATGYNNYTDNVIPSGTSYYGIFHSISVGPSNFTNNNISSEYGLFLKGVSDQLVVGGRYNVGAANAIELAGSSSIFIANTTATSISGIGLRINGGTGSTIENVTISGGTFGASITNTDQNLFNNIVVTGKGMNFVTSNNNSITNSTIANSTYIGIALHLGNGNNITNNTIEGNDYYGIQSSENNTLILNNTFNNNADAASGSGATIKLNGSADVNITQNIINGSIGYGILGENTTSESNIWIINNTIENSTVAGIELFNQLTMLIVGNNIIKNNPIGISANISTEALNFANGTIQQNTIENSTEIGIYANYNLTNITNNSITKSGLGMIIANSTTAILNSNHYFNNTNDLLINNSATATVNATNETFDNPNGDFAHFSSIDFYHAPSSNEAFGIDWEENGTLAPTSATSVANKYTNITNISATFTINSITFNYDSADETNEANFTVFKYASGTWTQVSTTVNATSNKATITSITSPGVYALFEYSPEAESPTTQTSASGSNGDERTTYQIIQESECGNNTVILRSRNGQTQGVHIFIIQNGQIIRDGITDERGEFRYQLNEAAQIQIRMGSSSFFGPFAIEYCQNNQTQDQNQTMPQIIEEVNEQQEESINSEVPQRTELPDQVRETESVKSNSTSTAAQNQNRADNTQEAQGNSKNTPINWPVGIILVLILIAGVGVYYFFIRKK
jgi:parallel beta-helix repeat protein